MTHDLAWCNWDPTQPNKYIFEKIRKMNILITMGARTWSFETFLEHSIQKVLRRTVLLHTLISELCLKNTNMSKSLDVIVNKKEPTWSRQKENIREVSVRGYPSFFHSFLLKVYFEISLSPTDLQVRASPGSGSGLCRAYETRAIWHQNSLGFWRNAACLPWKLQMSCAAFLSWSRQ